MIVVRIEMSRDKLFNNKTAHSIPNLKNVFKTVPPFHSVNRGFI